MKKDKPLTANQIVDKLYSKPTGAFKETSRKKLNEWTVIIQTLRLYGMKITEDKNYGG